MVTPGRSEQGVKMRSTQGVLAKLAGIVDQIIASTFNLEIEPSLMLHMNDAVVVFTEIEQLGTSLTVEPYFFNEGLIEYMRRALSDDDNPTGEMGLLCTGMENITTIDRDDTYDDHSGWDFYNSGEVGEDNVDATVVDVSGASKRRMGYEIGDVSQPTGVAQLPIDTHIDGVGIRGLFFYFATDMPPHTDPTFAFYALKWPTTPAVQTKRTYVRWTGQLSIEP